MDLNCCNDILNFGYNCGGNSVHTLAVNHITSSNDFVSLDNHNSIAQRR
jgi:hypothetical protein